MKKILTIILFMGLFQSQANAQPDFSNLIEIQPNPAMEGQMVTIGFVVGCRNWTDHSFSVNGFIIDYQVTYHYCIAGIAPPEGFIFLDLDTLPAGDYEINLTITDAYTPPLQYQETITFGVLPMQQVPFNSTLMYLLLGSLLLIIGVVFQKRAFLKKH